MILGKMLMPQAGGTLKTGLISCWEFDEASGTTAYDSSPNAHNLVSYGCAVNQTGKINKAYNHNGSTSYLRKTTSTAAFEGLSAISVSCWCNPEVIDSTAKYRMLISKRVSGWVAPYYQFELRMYPYIYKRFEFWVGNASANSYVASANNSVALYTWYHIVGTWNGSDGSFQFYINGANAASVVSGAITGATGSGSTPLYIGEDNDSLASALPWSGLIDQTAIWNRVLTTQEIAQLYNSGNGLAFSGW